MNRRKLKNFILHQLAKDSLTDVFRSFEKYPENIILKHLFSALCSSNEQVRWNTICCFGTIVSRLAEHNIEDSRTIMRRLLWSLNDESGGIGWGAPESMAEIMCHCRQLRNEYLHMLISYMREDGDELFQDGNYLELPMLQRGLLWGIGRLCQFHDAEMSEKKIVPDLVDYLSSADVVVSAMAIWCLGLLKAKSTIDMISAFTDRKEVVRIYRNNIIEDAEVGGLALEAIQLMKV